MLPDFSSRKSERPTTSKKWPGRFRPLSPREPKSEFFPEPEPATFTPEPVEAAELPDFAVDIEPVSEIPEPVELAPLSEELPQTEELELPQIDDASPADIEASPIALDTEIEETPSLTETPEMDVQLSGADDSLQQILDRVDGAIVEALDPLASNISDAVLSAMKSILCKDVREEGFVQIRSFIETMVPKKNDLTVRVSGPEYLVEDMRQQLNSMEDAPTHIEFLVKDQLTDLIVTYDTTSISTRLGELETLLLEASQ